MSLLVLRSLLRIYLHVSVLVALDLMEAMATDVVEDVDVHTSVVIARRVSVASARRTSVAARTSATSAITSDADVIVLLRLARHLPAHHLLHLPAHPHPHPTSVGATRAITMLNAGPITKYS